MLFCLVQICFPVCVADEKSEKFVICDDLREPAGTCKNTCDEIHESIRISESRKISHLSTAEDVFAEEVFSQIFHGVL